MNTAQSLPNIECEASPNGDIYIGKPEDLIAAGVLTAEQIPGWPGMPSTSASFVDGVVQPRGQKPKHDERWMQVSRYGGNIRCIKGISVEEQRLRSDIRRAELEEAERNKPKVDVGMDGALKAFAVGSAVHKVGDRVRCGNQSMVVTGEYRLRCVRAEDGEYIDSAGDRIDYRYGYTCQFRNGEEYFFPPHELTDDEGSSSHLRLVHGAREVASLPTFSLKQ